MRHYWNAFACYRKRLLIFSGFILGFDNETDDIFDRQIEFITAAAIPNAMVGQLGALPNTPLLTRMQAEGRLLHSLTDDQGFGPFYSNFKTKLPYEKIVRGQRRILETIYQPRTYFDRLAEAYRRLPRETNRLQRIKRLLFPSEFVGRGDMSRGGLLLRCAADCQELSYIPIQGAILHGVRPPKLEPRRYPKDSPI